MWMRVARSRIDPARISEDSTLQEDLAEAFRQLPGYQSFMLGVDRATGELINVSTFDTEEHATIPRGLSKDLSATMPSSSAIVTSSTSSPARVAWRRSHSRGIGAPRAPTCARDRHGSYRWTVMAELPPSSRAEWIAARLQALGAPTSTIEHAQLGPYNDFNSERPNRHSHNLLAHARSTGCTEIARLAAAGEFDNQATLRSKSSATRQKSPRAPHSNGAAEW
jgi:hypothetical protein